MAWFLDTNACITYLRNANAHLTSRWRKHRADEVAIPLPVYAELVLGAEKSSKRERVLREIQALLQPHRIVRIDEAVAQHYARIRADLERRGTPISGNDLWIAATTLAHRATLVTNNTAEFSRVQGLSLEDWTQP